MDFSMSHEELINKLIEEGIDIDKANELIINFADFIIKFNNASQRIRKIDDTLNIAKIMASAISTINMYIATELNIDPYVLNTLTASELMVLTHIEIFTRR